jgi:hypothetical protein
MEQPGAGNFTQHRAWIGREASRQFSSALAIERTSRLEVVGAVQDSADHVPLRQAHRVIADRVEHAAIVLAFGPRPRSTGGPMSELGWARIIGDPAIQLRGGSIPQRVVQPYRPKPAMPFRVRHAELLRPIRGELRDAPNMLQSRWGDDRPLGQTGPEL